MGRLLKHSFVGVLSPMLFMTYVELSEVVPRFAVDHIGIKIRHAGSKAQDKDKGIPETMVCRILILMSGYTVLYYSIS